MIKTNADFFTQDNALAIAIIPIQTKHLAQFKETLSHDKKNWLESVGFKANSGEIILMPSENFSFSEVYLGVSGENDSEALAKAAMALKPGSYYLKGVMSQDAILAWGLAQYQFDTYKAKKNDAGKKQLVLEKKALDFYQSALEAHFLVRDLINTPCEDLGPKALEEEAIALAATYEANCKTYKDEGFEKDFPAIYAVGKAAKESPRLIELTWGEESNPKVTLVGKGVCFDTGGLDLKPSSNMRIMKKDMGGAAHVLGLAKMIMAQKLPIYLKVLIPAVENAISADAYRPGDIITTKAGLSVEIDNTDAEGRVVLSDALCVAKADNPEIIIDFATLTGAARVAVGTDIAAMFTNDDAISDALMNQAKKTNDWVWRLPLFQPYLKHIQPPIADLANSAKTGFGGAIHAALFLEQFVGDTPWVHFDVMAWNNASRPGKPEGGEALGLHTVYHYLANRYEV